MGATNPMHLRKSQYSWLQQVLITKTVLPDRIRCVIAVTMALESVWAQPHSP